MNTVIQNQRKERDELLARHYLVRKSNTNASVLLANPMIKLITGPRRVGKSTYALLMFIVLPNIRQVVEHWLLRHPEHADNPERSLVLASQS